MYLTLNKINTYLKRKKVPAQVKRNKVSHRYDFHFKDIENRRTMVLTLNDKTLEEWAGLAEEVYTMPDDAYAIFIQRKARARTSKPRSASRTRPQKAKAIYFRLSDTDYAKVMALAQARGPNKLSVVTAELVSKGLATLEPKPQAAILESIKVRARVAPPPAAPVVPPAPAVTAPMPTLFEPPKLSDRIASAWAALTGKAA